MQDVFKMLALRPLLRMPLYLQTGRGAAFELQRRGKKKKAKAAPARGATDESDGLDLTPYRTDMQKTLDSATHDIGNIRVSEANPALLDGTLRVIARAPKSLRYNTTNLYMCECIVTFALIERDSNMNI